MTSFKEKRLRVIRSSNTLTIMPTVLLVVIMKDIVKRPITVFDMALKRKNEN